MESLDVPWQNVEKVYFENFLQLIKQKLLYH